MVLTYRLLFLLAAAPVLMLYQNCGSLEPGQIALISSSNQPIDTVVPGSTLAIVPNGVSGGGFQSSVLISTDGETVFSAGDVSGVNKSTDGGRTYFLKNRGLRSVQVASLALTEDNTNILYAGTGDKGNSGGLYRSLDGGNTWEETADGNRARFAGNHSASSDPLPQGHPRSNGNLILVINGNNPETHSDDIVIAGTYRDGVRIFTNGGDSEVSSVNTNGFVRSLAHSNSAPSIAYAAIYFNSTNLNGIYRIDFSNLASPTSTLVYPTPNPEGLVALANGSVYGAIGSGGIVKYDGQTWSLKNSGLSTGNINRKWSALAGYSAGTTEVLYAGMNNSGGATVNEDYSNIWRSTNGGDSWTPLVDASSNVSDRVYGQNYGWWFRTDAFREAGLGRRNSIVSSIALTKGIDPVSIEDDVIYVSGRGGLWKSDNGGAQWSPAVHNMQVTSNQSVAVNPNFSSQVALANTDFVVLGSTDRFANGDLSRDRPNGSASRAYDILFDSTNDQIVVGTGDRDTNRAGGVFRKRADQLSNSSDTSWDDLRIQDVSSGRVRAIAVGYHDGSAPTEQTILAAVENDGIYRYYRGQWARSNGVSIGSTRRSRFLWPASEKSGTVYLLDLSTGLCRSNDGGVTWQNIWPEMSFNNNDFFNSGYIASNNESPTTLYISIQGRSGSPLNTKFKVYRINDAHKGVLKGIDDPKVDDISIHSGAQKITRPGPLAVSPLGELWLTENQDAPNGVKAGLFRMTQPESDSSFTRMTFDDYEASVPSPSGIAISVDGFIYISQTGMGLVKIQQSQ